MFPASLVLSILHSLIKVILPRSPSWLCRGWNRSRKIVFKFSLDKEDALGVMGKVRIILPCTILGWAASVYLLNVVS